MILKLRSVFKRTKANVLYFKQFGDGSIVMRTASAKYQITKWTSMSQVKRWGKENSYEEVKVYKKLTEVQWLDKVCENFKE